MKEHLTADFILHLDSFEPSRKPFRSQVSVRFSTKGGEPTQKLVRAWFRSSMAGSKRVSRIRASPSVS